MTSHWVRNLRLSVAAAAIALCIAHSSSATAQAVYGQILGTVTDATGAAIPGATVTVTDLTKGTSVQVQSNGSGDFTVAHLIPDIYNIKVVSAGFKGFEQTGLVIHADDSGTVKAILAVGGSDQIVTVNADQVAQLKTDRSDVATTFDAAELTELPIPDHNFTNLQLLLPGAVQLGWAHAASENPQGSKQINIDGQAFGGVNFTLDGTDNEDAILGIIVINPNSESMSEAKLTTQNFDAEFGKAVAEVASIQTKSGTNAFHGTLFDNRESNANLARDPFTVSKAQGYPGGLKNQFGGSIGGPILKDKVFFFGDYQGVRQRIGSPATATVPTLRVLQTCTAASGNCDFSDYLPPPTPPGGTTPTVPAGVFPGTQLYDNANGGVPFVGNLIPVGRLAPQAVNLFKLLLAGKYQPNIPGQLASPQSGVGLSENYAGTGTGLFNSNQWDVRGDAVISQRVHVFGRFSRFTDILSGASLFGAAGGPGLGIAGYGGISNGANDSLALGTDIAINSKLITDVRLGYFRYDISTRKNDTGNTNLPFIGENTSGATPSLTVATNYGTPYINIADVNVTSLTGTSNPQNQGAQYGSGLNVNHCNCPLKEKEDQFQIVNNWTKTLGNHAIKAGADLRYARNLRVPSDSDRTGVNNFYSGPTSNGLTGGLGYATFALGDVGSFNRYAAGEPSEPNAKEFQARDYFYLQDTWRATPKLTINAGLRYEYYAPERVNGTNNGALLNLATGYINVAGNGGIPLNMGVAAAKNTYNPRLGVAYQVNSKTVVRAGYGRSFDLGVFGSTFGHVVTQNLPVLANQSLNGTGGNTSYAFNLANPGATGNGATSPLANFTPPAISANGTISIAAIIPGTGATVGQSVSVKARPFTERLPTLDAWNAVVQRSITPTLSLEVAYVGNKGTHTLSDGDGNNTNPNESAITLPAAYSVTGTTLHYDPNGGNCVQQSLNPGVQCAAGGKAINPATGATSNQTLLQRYVGGSLPACVGDPYGGACGWTQSISYYGDDQDTHYNALQIKLTKAYTRGLSISSNYAYQVGRDAASSFATWDKQAVIGNDSNIRRSAFTAYGLYHLPFGKGQMFLDRGGIVNYLVSGFEFSPTVVYQSGLPFSLSYNECSQNTPGDAPCQPNGNVNGLSYGVKGVPGVGNGVSFFTPLASSICNTAGTAVSGFSCPGLDQIGSIRRNTAWGPRFFNSDMSISKALSVHERYEVKFRMDAYNAFNHINLGTPNGNIDGGGGGITSGPYPASVSGTTNPRQLQFTIHLAF